MWYKWRHLEPSFSSLDAPVGQFWVSVSSSGMENREFSVGQGHRTAASTLGWGESEKSLQPSSLGWPGGQGAASELPEGNKRLKKSQACAFPAGGAEEREAEEWEDVAESGGARSAWLGCGGPAPGVQSSVCPHVSPAWSPALLWHLQPLALVSFAVSPLGIPSRADPGVAQSQLPPRQRKPCTHCREVFHL